MTVLKQIIKKLDKAVLLGLMIFSAIPVFGQVNRGKVKERVLEEGPPTVCVSNVDLAKMQQQLPQIFKDFGLMAQLPLTGKPVYDVLVNPKNAMTTCVFDLPLERDLPSWYVQKRLMISKNNGTTTTLHQFFHAAQDVDRRYMNLHKLTGRDAAIAVLLVESTAIAYELAVQQEAKNRGVALKSNPLTFTSDMPEAKTAFQAAYDKAWTENATSPVKTREAKALEAGGKSVVRWLLDGQQVRWNMIEGGKAKPSGKKALPVAACNNTPAFRENYPQMRRDIYTQLGKVSAEINFVPDELRSLDADRSIAKYFSAIRLLDSQAAELQQAQCAKKLPMFYATVKTVLASP